MTARPSTMPATLADLEQAIRYEHDAATTAARTAIEHAIRCGELLADAKAQVPHGGWAGWLAEHFPASDRTARGYMRLAAHAEQVDRQGLADLGIEGALRQLAAPPAERSRLEDVRAALPDLDNATEAALRESIDRFGVLVPVVTDQRGKLIDGHHRSRIAKELGISYQVTTVVVTDDAQAAEICLSLNADRADYGSAS